jgi:hypothetical protein
MMVLTPHVLVWGMPKLTDTIQVSLEARLAGKGGLTIKFASHE